MMMCIARESRHECPVPRVPFVTCKYNVLHSCLSSRELAGLSLVQ